ncbi:hypothetical protein RO3G_09851 [Rhizopus delemar RA 99-880]|uniref:Uncharacterized protein n=1 Tax=Rhizopus delemar (strain RA 99-880 / ATCC MYA-4621 / FGSC 9543 / NRRL 43880) TaxID=246409 RepID=I1C9L1_RHIO9|nr:hypothetical protein RO3G_09851 [Rhizopus delemar RA 99-880]|eukprot:EIE85141.1 hypothetical protein RO3G_09851 [Rhizopus delemar RA 99-880]
MACYQLKYSVLGDKQKAKKTKTLEGFCGALNSFLFKEYSPEEAPKESVQNNSRAKLDLIEFLNCTEKEVILVALDYAGLSINVTDLKNFLRLPVTSEVEVFETKLLIQNQSMINKFDCRPRSVQRSL